MANNVGLSGLLHDSVSAIHIFSSLPYALNSVQNPYQIPCHVNIDLLILVDLPNH